MKKRTNKILLADLLTQLSGVGHHPFPYPFNPFPESASAAESVFLSVQSVPSLSVQSVPKIR